MKLSKTLGTLICVAFFVAINTACSEKTVKLSEEILLETSQTPIDAQDIISDYKLIPLEITDNSILRKASKIRKKDSTYYIYENTADVIYVYESDGKFRGKIDAKGGGFHEYADIRDFYLSKDMLVLFVFPYKLLFFNPETLEPVMEPISFEKSYSQILLKDDCCYLYSDYRGVLDVYDFNKKELLNVFHYEPLKGLIPFPTVMHEVDGKIFVCIPGDDTLYSLEHKELKKVCSLNYNNRKNSIDFYSNREMGPLQMDELSTYSLPNITAFFKTGNDLLGFIYSFQGQFWVNLPNANSDYGRTNYSLTTDLPMYPSILCTNEDQLISWGYLFGLGRIKESSFIRKSDVEKIQQTNEDPETIVLIEYKLKNSY